MHQIPFTFCASPFIVGSMADTAVFVLRGDTNTQLNGEEEKHCFPKAHKLIAWADISIAACCRGELEDFGFDMNSSAYRWQTHVSNPEISHYTINMHERLHSNKAGLFLVAKEKEE